MYGELCFLVAGCCNIIVNYIYQDWKCSNLKCSDCKCQDEKCWDWQNGMALLGLCMDMHCCRFHSWALQTKSRIEPHSAGFTCLSYVCLCRSASHCYWLWESTMLPHLHLLITFLSVTDITWAFIHTSNRTGGTKTEFSEETLPRLFLVGMVNTCETLMGAA